jgi:hypothetical protein
VADQGADLDLPEQVLAATIQTFNPLALQQVGQPGGTGQRRRDSRTTTPVTRRPSTCGASARRVTSTSGSSGMVLTV